MPSTGPKGQHWASRPIEIPAGFSPRISRVILVFYTITFLYVLFLLGREAQEITLHAMALFGPSLVTTIARAVRPLLSGNERLFAERIT